MNSSFQYAVVLDFEATCDNNLQPQPQEIIEFPSVLVELQSLSTIDEFSSFVRPQHHPILSYFCTELTSIDQHDVDQAQSFAEVFVQHQNWLQSHGLTPDNALLVTCGDWDLKSMLPAQCLASLPPIEELPKLYTQWLNIKVLFQKVMLVSKSGGMVNMLRALNLPLKGHHHRGIDDCHNIAQILKSLALRGGTIELSAQLAAHKMPPISIQFKFGEEHLLAARLEYRTLTTLHNLFGKLFKVAAERFVREDGRFIKKDEDLRDLRTNEVITVIN